MKKVTIVLFLIFVSSVLRGEDVLIDRSSLYISLGKNAFFFKEKGKVYVNIPGAKFAGQTFPGKRTILLGDKKLILSKPLIVVAGKSFISYDDYLRIYKHLPHINHFYVVHPMDKSGFCHIERYVEDLDYLKKLSLRKSPITIVLDPGHGGEDSGAIGPWCHMEKDLVLRIAALVAEILAKRTSYRIILTRYGDYYITLKGRSDLANSSRANLFVSIHANAAPRPTARGVETFLLALNPADEEAKHVAALENKWAEETGEFKWEKKVKRIVNDLLQSQVTMRSALLAQDIQSNVVKMTRGLNRGVRKANFWVLLGTKMPAVLVEVGFISNAEEEKKLFSLKYQKKIAEGIADGIIKFLKGEEAYEARWQKK